MEKRGFRVLVSGLVLAAGLAFFAPNDSYAGNCRSFGTCNKTQIPNPKVVHQQRDAKKLDAYMALPGTNYVAQAGDTLTSVNSRICQGFGSAILEQGYKKLNQESLDSGRLIAGHTYQLKSSLGSSSTHLTTTHTRSKK